MTVKPMITERLNNDRLRKSRNLLRTTLLALLAAVPVYAQVSPEEHAKHHPGGSGPPGMTTNAPGPGGMGGMMGGGGMGDMGKMMEKMGAPAPKELYPSLMSLPDLPLEKRADVQQQAHERMQSGAALMSQGLDALSQAAPTDNYAAMQEAVAKLREGIAQFDSGLAAHRALAEGKAPRNVALQWFKREMNLLPPGGAPDTRLGRPAFHLVVIAILGAFAVVMIWMYFFKMRRASALLKSLADAGVAASPAPTKPAVGQESAPAASARPVIPPVTAESDAVSKPVEPPKFPAMRSRTEPVEKWSGKLRVCRVFQETPEVKTFRLAAEHDVALPFTYFPGQFLTLSLNINGKHVKRSYTIASTPTQLHYCAITVKREESGLVSRFLHDQVKEGDLLEVAAANGKFTFTGEEAQSIVLIGGGVGITPMMSVIRYLTDVGWRGDVFLLYCCRTTRDFIFREELEHLQERHPNLHVFATMTRAAGTVWMGLKGRFTAEIISHLVPEITARRVHVCGPPSMMSAMLAMLKALKVPDDQVKTEAFGPAKKPGAQPSQAGAQKVSVPAAETAAPATSAAVTVAFKRSGKSAPIPPSQTVLEAADATGVEIDNSCRSGQCGLCKVKLVAGVVTMDCEDALAEEDKQQGLILACQARAKENIEVDA